MTNTVSAAAPGLPTATTRRRALASLAGLGATLGLPKAARAASLAVAPPDTVLIAHAAMVEEMIARCNAAWDRQYDLEERVDELKPPRPIRPADAVARRQHEAALATWKSTCDALKEETGYTAAEDLARDLYQALQDAVVDLTPMLPTTLAGLAAKARCAVALDPKGYFALNGWENALIAAVARDAAAIGGEA